MRVGLKLCSYLIEPWAGYSVRTPRTEAASPFLGAAQDETSLRIGEVENACGLSVRATDLAVSFIFLLSFFLSFNPSHGAPLRLPREACVFGGVFRRFYRLSFDFLRASFVLH